MGELGGLKNYLKKAEETKDAEMLRRWRTFVHEVLYPLDEKVKCYFCRKYGVDILEVSLEATTCYFTIVASQNKK